MSNFTAILDACVLYPAPLRDFLIHLHCVGLYRARWSEEIHEEWTRNLLANRQDLNVGKIQRTRELMNEAVADSLVTGHMQIIEGLSLPDPDDRHVLAAAICGKAEVIVTFNEKDFPGFVLRPFNVEAQHPDEFISNLISINEMAVCQAFKNQLISLKNPPKTADQLLDTLNSQGLTTTVSRLRPWASLMERWE